MVLCGLSGHFLRIVVCALSLSALIYFTWQASERSLATIEVCAGAKPADESPEDVNGYITLGFGVGNVLCDMISLCAFYRGSRNLQH